jgi:hypothetical protein
LQVLLANRDITLHEEGLADAELSSGMALALERVIANIVRPLQWYVCLFVLYAFFLFFS